MGSLHLTPSFFDGRTKVSNISIFTLEHRFCMNDQPHVFEGTPYEAIPRMHAEAFA